MNRRSFLRGLLALPLAPLAAKLLPEAPAGIPINHTEDMKVTEAYVGVVESPPWSSDQTSIWLINWGDNHPYMQDLPWDPKSVRTGPRNWLKESIRGN